MSPSFGAAMRLSRNNSFVFPNLLIHPASSPPLDDQSILLYVSLSGSNIPFRVLESDSIESVKLQIQSLKGFVAKIHKLVCRGRELSRNNSLVRDYGLVNGDVLHLVLRLCDLQVIHVKTARGKEIALHARRGRDVGYVKEQVAEKTNGFAYPNEQEVEFNGDRNEDQRPHCVLSNRYSTVIHLFVGKSARIRATRVEKNIEVSIVAPDFKNAKSWDANKESNIPTENEPQDETQRKEYEEGEIDWREPVKRSSLLEPIIINPKVELPSSTIDLINLTSEGLESRHQPVRSMEGTGGAYFMPDLSGHKHVSVFKPVDEEPLAVNNPRGLPLSTNGEGLKKGTKVGEGAIREVAAYLLDHPKSGPRSLFGDGKGFAGVPPTVLVTCLHEGFIHPKDKTMKLGSLQMFIDNLGSCEDIGPGNLPVDEVHKISVLDIRLANADRHGGNILLSKKGNNGRIVLTPIDHGYCLPESFEDCTYDWLYWPQVRQPFSEETINYIRSLDAEEDIALLKFHGWNLPSNCACIFRVSTMLLKKGVEKGLTPFAIGSIMCRENVSKRSIIEEIVEEAENSLLLGANEAAFLDRVSQVMERRLDDIASCQPESCSSGI